MSQHRADMFRMSCGATAPLELNVSGPGCAGGQRRVFEHPFVLVGRHEHSCLRLEDGAVSRRHAYLQQLGGRVFCVDLGSRTGIRWRGEARSAGWLSSEQGVQIGPFTLELPMAAQAGEGADNSVAEPWDPLQDRVDDPQFLPRVSVQVGNQVLSRLRMNRALVLVGSSPDCRIHLQDARVSRYHCSLLRTPQGVWLIDLLPGTGTCLNGQPLRWALLKEGDRLQVGPFVLRISYPDGRSETSPPTRVEIPAGTPEESEEWGVRSEEKKTISSPLTPHSSLSPEAAVTEGSGLVSALQAELDQARERQRDTEILRQQLTDRQAECERLREQGRVLEVQVAEAASLQTRLEASIRELDAVRSERDRWQVETQTLQARLVTDAAEREQLDRLAADLHAAQREREQACARLSELERAQTEAAAAQELARQTHDGAVRDVQARADAEREEWRMRLEAAELQFVEEREAVRAAGARLDQECAALQSVQADLAARNAEHDATLQQLQEIREELALSQNETHNLHAELDKTLECQRDVETLRQQLADAWAERTHLRARVPELEGRANLADHLEARLQETDAEMERLRVQLRAAESREAEWEAMRAECERLREQGRVLEVQVAEAAGLQTRLEASVRELDAVRSERDRWQVETQTLQARPVAEAAEREQLDRLAADLHAAQREREQACARLSELERAQTEAAAAQEAALEEVRVRWESERQALEARLESARQSHDGAVQAAVRDVQARVTAEREEWRRRLEGAESQIVWERGMFQEQSEKLRQQTASLQADRDRLAAQVAQAELSLRAAQERSPDEAGRAAELQHLQQQVAQEQVFAELATIRPGHLFPQTAWAPGRAVPAEQPPPQAPLAREQAPVEEQRRPTAIAPEVPADWGETATGKERQPALCLPSGRVGEQVSEAGRDTGREKTVEHRSAPAAAAIQADEGEASAPADAPNDSAESWQPAEHAHSSPSQRKGSQPETRQRLWRQILGFMLRK